MRGSTYTKDNSNANRSAANQNFVSQAAAQRVEEEELQMKPISQLIEDEELAQGKFETPQLVAEEELMQGKFEAAN